MEKRNAYAKINLTLEILDKRADGYHELRSVMQKVSLCDILSFSERSDGKITLCCSKDVCKTEDNLVYKAAVLYSQEYFKLFGKHIGCDIYLEKVIPDKAGLAGGSSDCACVLDYLFDKYPLPEYSAVEHIAASLGSDINFCLDKYICAMCTGRGTDIFSCDSLSGKSVVVCTPDFSMKTSEIYREYDNAPDYPNVNYSEGMINALKNASMDNVKKYVFNSFTKLCSQSCSDIAVIKKILSDNGAEISEMSGSGASVFGIFESVEKAECAYNILKRKYCNTFICNTL